MRGLWGAVFSRLCSTVANASGDASTEHAWHALLAAPLLLLFSGRQGRSGRPTRQELEGRFSLWHARRFQDLWALALRSVASPSLTPPTPCVVDPSAPPNVSSVERAMGLLKVSEYSRAAQCLTGGPMAPATLDTLSKLRDPERRPQQQYAPVPPLSLPDQDVQLQDDVIISTLKYFFSSLKSTRRGVAGGPLGLCCASTVLWSCP